MNNKLLILVCGLAIGSLGSWAIFHVTSGAAEKKEGAEATTPETKETGPGITLTPPQIAQVGIKTVLPHPVKLLEERTGFGQVLDPSALLNGVAEIALAQANADASEKERLRLKELHENGDNASGQSVDAATLTAQRDRIQLSTSLTKLKSAWGPLIASETDRQRLAAQLTAGGSLLRVDFGGNEDLSGGKTVTLHPLGGSEALIAKAEILSPAMSIDAQFQGQSFWAIVSDKTLPVGANFEARLTLPESGKNALAVPSTALLRNDGKVFLYVQISAEKFSRKTVKVLQPIADEEAISGVDATDRVVTVGAQQLLSAELGGEASGD